MFILFPRFFNFAALFTGFLSEGGGFGAKKMLLVYFNFVTRRRRSIKVKGVLLLNGKARGGGGMIVDGGRCLFRMLWLLFSVYLCPDSSLSFHLFLKTVSKRRRLISFRSNFVNETESSCGH